MDLHSRQRSCFSFFMQQPTSFLVLQVAYWQSMDLHSRQRSCFSFFMQQPTSFLVPGPLPTRPASFSSAQGLPCFMAQTWYAWAKVLSQPAHGSCSPAPRTDACARAG